MQTKFSILGLGLLMVCNLGFSQSVEPGRLCYPFLTIESQSNLVFTADADHPRACPVELTNVISNTNLFTVAEQQKLKEVELKYQNISTNAGAAGSVFTGMQMRQWRLGEFTDKFLVACFKYTNSQATDELRIFDCRVRYRTESGAGYDVRMSRGRLVQYQEYAGGVLNGLFVDSTFDRAHCNSLARFTDGKMVGRFLNWSKNGEIVMDIYFKEPFDFLKYQTIKHDMAWTEVMTNATPPAGAGAPSGDTDGNQGKTGPR